MIFPFDGANSNGNGPRIEDRGSGNTNLPSEIKMAQNANGEVLTLSLPLRTESEANGGVKKSFMRNGKKCYKNEHWTDKHKRHKMQKNVIFLALKPKRDKLRLPCHIILTRYAPRSLDRHDNLPCSFKYILDALCAVITGNYAPGRADSDGRITVAYDQVKSSDYRIKIEIIC